MKLVMRVVVVLFGCEQVEVVFFPTSVETRVCPSLARPKITI